MLVNQQFHSAVKTPGVAATRRLRPVGRCIGRDLPRQLAA
jgi:hypothetical protein